MAQKRPTTVLGVMHISLHAQPAQVMTWISRSVMGFSMFMLQPC